MSRLEELIEELCPKGVEYKILADILKIRNGSDYKSFPLGNIPVCGVLGMHLTCLTMLKNTQLGVNKKILGIYLKN